LRTESLRANIHEARPVPFWSKVSCPVDLQYEAWTYLRTRWLVDQLGSERLLAQTQVLPTDARFEGVVRDGVLDPQAALMVVSDVMGVTAQDVGLVIRPDVEIDALGRYVPGPRPEIWLAESHLSDVHGVIATLAHELAHHLLLGSRYLTEEEYDHEYLTDLVTAYLGFGVFAANCTVREQSRTFGRFHWWQTKKQGYLPARVYGWVLSLVSYLVGANGDSFADYLRLDAQTPYRQGMKYLRNHGVPELVGDLRLKSRRPVSDGELVQSLQCKRDVSRLMALRMFGDRPDASREHAQQISGLMRDARPEIRSEAADAITVLGYSDGQTIPSLIDLLRDGSSAVRIAAATCAHHLVLDDRRIIDDLALMLDTDDDDEILVAACALSQYGERAMDHRRLLLPHLQKYLVRCQHEHADQLLWAYAAICIAAEVEIREYFEARDEELCSTALAMLKEILIRERVDEQSDV
jgi:hypothetical protein